jgi:hypothetical protein
MATGRRMLRVRIRGTVAEVRAFLSRHPLEEGPVRFDGARVVVDATLRESLVDVARERRLEVEVLFDADERGREAMGQVSRTNRFAAGGIPLGLGLRRRVR